MNRESTALWIECNDEGEVLRGSDEALELLESLEPPLRSLAPYIARRPDLEGAMRRRDGTARLGLRRAGQRLSCDAQVSEGSRGSIHVALALLPLSREPSVADSLRDWAVASRDGVALCDADGHILFANPALLGQAGLSAEEIFGRDLLTLTASLGRGLDDEELRRSLFITGAWRGDRWMMRADGAIGLVELGLTALGGPPTRQWLAICRDINDQREREALALAEATSITTARLAAGISHDLNNLAAEIVVWSEEALMGADPDELRVALKRQLDLGLAVGGVGAQLRRLAGEPDDVGPTDCGELLQDIAWLLERASGRVRSVSATLPKQPMGIDAAGSVLRSLLLVLSIRVLHGSESPVELWASEEEGIAKLNVRCQVNREERERLRRLFPGHRMVSPLGNALMVRAMRAGLSLSLDAEDEQVTFSVSGTAVHPRQTREAPEPEVDPVRYGRALVAEDNEQLRVLIVRALEPMFDEVIATADGEEAWNVLLQHGNGIDVVITDVMMPNTGGAELLQQVRGRWPKLPMVLMSGLATEETVLPERGARERFLRKPFKLAALRSAVYEILVHR